MLKDAIERIRLIAETLEPDDPDKEEMLNIEGDYEALMEWCLRKRTEAKYHEVMLKSIIDDYRVRQTRFKNKAERMKELCGVILNAAGQRKYEGTSGTVSIGKKKQGVVVTDESKIPDIYFDTVKVLRKADLNKAVMDGETIDGAVLDNGGEQINIRIK